MTGGGQPVTEAAERDVQRVVVNARGDKVPESLPHHPGALVRRGSVPAHAAPHRDRDPLPVIAKDPLGHTHRLLAPLNLERDPQRDLNRIWHVFDVFDTV